MNQNEQDIENIEISITQAKKILDKMKYLQSLTKHPAFENVILKGYFEEEASRLVLLKADPSMQTAEGQEAITKAIDAIGHFRQYLHTVMQFGRMAEKDLEEQEGTLEELHNEGLSH